MRFSSSLSLVLVTALLVVVSIGDQLVADDSQADALRETIRQLDSDDFQHRKAAADSLFESGTEAIESIKQAAIDGEGNLGVESVRLLERMKKSSDEKLSAAAETALEEVAGSENERTARLAKDTLQKKIEQPIPQPQRPNIVINGFNGGGNVRIAMKTQTINGETKTVVTDNDRKVEITENRAGKISVKLTETVNGKEKTTEYEADSLEDLKKKHPEGAKLYEKYKKGNAIQIQMQAFGQIRGFPPGKPPFWQGGQKHPAHQEIEKSLDELSGVLEKLEQLKEQPNADKEQLGEMVQELRNVQKGLFAAQKKLER